MSRRIDIELTSSQPDGNWTWRAAGAKVPKGVLDGGLLPPGSAVGDLLKVEVEQEIDGITVLSVVQGRTKAERADVIELLPSDRPFEPVIQQRATRDRDDRRDRKPRRDRGDGPGDRRGDRRGEGRGRDGRPGEGRSERGDRRGEGRGEGRERRPDRGRPSFTPPPEVPQRPKPKRLRPGKARKQEVLSSIPEEQRPIAELALQGMAAVRQRLAEDNKVLVAEGKPAMPEASVLKMAEELLPRLRVADWLDRAEAALRQMEHLDLRDLRSVVAASDDPMVARDESTRAVAEELKQALVTKQEHELALWLEDIEVALSVGRVIRALRLSSQPPKAGVPFPGELATRLAEAASTSLAPTDAPDRWSAVLEAAAFSPVRTHVTPASAPEQTSDELRATVTRLAPAMPQIATLFGIEVPAGAPMPKPLRPAPRPKAAPKTPPARPAPAPRPAADAPVAAEPATAAPATEPTEPDAAPAEPEATEPEASEADAPAAADPEVETATPAPEATVDEAPVDEAPAPKVETAEPEADAPEAPAEEAATEDEVTDPA